MPIALSEFEQPDAHYPVRDPMTAIIGRVKSKRDQP